MDRMKKARLRDLRKGLGELDRKLRAKSGKKKLRRPDFLARLRQSFGKKKLSAAGTDVVVWDRGDK